MVSFSSFFCRKEAQKTRFSSREKKIDLFFLGGGGRHTKKKEKKVENKKKRRERTNIERERDEERTNSHSSRQTRGREAKTYTSVQSITIIQREENSYITRARGEINRREKERKKKKR